MNPAYFPAYLLSASASLALGLYALLRANGRTARDWASIPLCQASWGIGFLFELFDRTIEGKIFWDDVEMASMVLLAYFTLLFALRYRDGGHSRTGAASAFLALPPIAIVFLQFTDRLHGLFRSTVSLSASSGFPELLYVYNPASYAAFSIMVAYIMLAVLLVARSALVSTGRYRTQAIYIAAGFSLPLCVLLITTVSGIRFGPYRDSSPLVFPIGNILVAFGLFRYRLLNAVPVAHASIVENLRDGVLVVDRRGTIVEFSVRLEQLLSVKSSSMIGLNAARALAFLGPVASALGSMPERPVRFTVSVADGTTDGKMLEVESSSLLDRGGRPIGGLATFRDATKRTMRERELAIYRSRLEQSNQFLSSALGELKAAQNSLIAAEKMASLGQLVATIAHELNTPLGAVKSSAASVEDALAILLDEMRSPSLAGADRRLVDLCLPSTFPADITAENAGRRKAERSIRARLAAEGIGEASIAADLLADSPASVEDFIAAYRAAPSASRAVSFASAAASVRRGIMIVDLAASKASATVSALRRYVRSAGGEPRDIPLVETLETVLRLFAAPFKTQFTLVRRYEYDGIVHADEERLQHVWLNLIQNALQDMGSAGELRISTRLHEGHALVSIVDNGPGIPADIRERVFDPFFTTKKAGEGTGLGLDIARRIVEDHGGTIALESEVGRTEFTVTLPVRRNE